MAIRKSHYCVCDTETTGLDTELRAEAIEVACLAVDCNNFKELNRFTTLIKPQNIDLNKPIPDWAKRAFEVNKINPEDLKKAPSPKEVCHKLIGFFKGLNKPIIVGHNIKFDILFLNRLFDSCDLRLADYLYYQSIDTCTVSHLLWAGDASVPNIKLTTVAQKLGIKYDAHRAMADVEANTKVFLKFMSFFAKVGGRILAECDSTPPAQPVSKSEYKCPECQTGYLVMRTAKKGKNAGSKFYGCSSFPQCSFACNIDVVQRHRCK